jgi:ribonuclease P protein component
VFPRAQRVRTSKDIVQIFRKGQKASRGVVSCSFLKKTGTLSRVTVIVDTKVSKKAVVRNLVKRRARSILASQTLPIGDIIIRLYKGADTVSFALLTEQIIQCLNRIG